MARIVLEDVSLDFPLLGANSRSLRSKLVPSRVGGNLQRDSSGYPIVKALKGISAQFEEGDKVALLGQNGSGKTTLLRVVHGIYQPTSGSALVEGSIGSLIDISLGFNPEATGRENIFLRASLLGMKKENIRQVFDEIVEFTELGDFIDVPIRTYSSGMQMRLAFAVSTLIQPEILLMDEWLSVGDESFRAKAEERLRQVVSGSQILLLASHSRALVESLCSKAVWLRHGSVVAMGSADTVISEYFSWRLESPK